MMDQGDPSQPQQLKITLDQGVVGIAVRLPGRVAFTVSRRIPPAESLTCEELQADDPVPDPGPDPEPEGEPEPVFGRIAAREYEVVSGDSLSLIAGRFYGDPTLWYLLWKENAHVVGLNWNLIEPGQVLSVPLLESFTPDDQDDARARSPGWSSPPELVA